MLRKLIYLLGVLLINRRVFNNYKFLMESQNWDLGKIKAYQLEKIKELLSHAYDSSQYYREKYDQSNFHPDQVNSLKDLEKIPVITKQEVLDNSHNIQITTLPEKLVCSKTSGSTGRPFMFYRNKDWDAWHRASVFRGYSWHGVKPWERSGYIWGYTFSSIQRIKIILLDYLQNQFRLFSFKDSDIDKFLRKLRTASYLEGYSSMVYEIAKRFNERKGVEGGFNLKMIKGTSETILDKYQQEVRKVFGRKMISEYGAAEAGIIAFECPQGNMHINMETVIVEEDNGEIIVTNLVSKSFPIIRYKIGDYVKIEAYKKCTCGISHLIIKEIVGRVGKIVYGHVHEYPSFTINYVFKNLAVEKNILLNYQAIQRTKGHLEISIDQYIKEEDKDLLMKEFNKYFGEDIVLKIVEGVNLKSMYKKKTGFISELCN